ncbi:16S rRNA (cytosine(1407)-C(5))-methyltransferase RsmF [Kangiella marina]|uniref:16S rRNA (Cytosine(1407)-C(5))-methyltransferase RsmF n=1 Tax=Kangiella marina TaxID=1079178 RepID=A0ABP8IG41_9GAMM
MAQISQHFIEHIEKQLPQHISLEELLAACQRPLRKSVRANLLKTTTSELRDQFEKAGYSLLPIPWCDEGFWVDESTQPLPDNIGNWLPHLQGQCYIQEASSMLPVKALLHDLEVNDHSKFLDMAAAPGSKTTQLASLTHNQGLIVANELSSTRLKGLYYNIQRCGLENTALRHADGRQFGQQTPEFFDAILLDAPCGGEGTVRKDEQALANWDINNVRSMSELQKELIVSAFKALKPGGRLVYSTCTLSREENQDVCKHLLMTYPEQVTVKPLNTLFTNADQAITEEGYLQVYPSIFDCEGFFVASFEKLGKSVEKEPAEPASKFTHLTKPSAKQLEMIVPYFNIFGWDLAPLQDELWVKKGKANTQEIWLIGKEIPALNQRLKLNRFGVKLLELNKHGPKIQHQAITTLGHHFTQQIVELTAQQASEYYQGKDIFLPAPEEPPKHKEVIVTYQQNPLGLAKHLGNKLKNNLPRELVRDKAFSELSDHAR